ncbi:hypothetical protein RB625_34865 [Streptomyces californicus]|uniref:hypothetical protein n=1 Tax=Streptomyces californicus TaxID=67351 RepID=UPI00296FF84A|nr:hypothetical protein [Streptomyces californicus]MDW4903584.1 hypothetical protein [Streptomyces californicus]
MLFLIVFGTACYTIFHLKSTPVRIAAVLLAMGSLTAAMAPIIRILAEPAAAPVAAYATLTPIAPPVLDGRAAEEK